MLMFLAAEGPNGFWYGDLNEVIWGTIAFLVLLVAFVMKGVPLIKETMEEKASSIEAELNAADQAKAEASAQAAELESQVGDADAEGAEMVAEARKTAAQLEVDMKAKAEADAQALRERGTAEVETMRRQAEADLQAEVSALSLGAAEAVVDKNLDPNTQRDLIEGYISDVAGMGS